ncbi:MAG: C-GCAxxG-C-C family protein [Desulfobulbaceae bacterium]|nr:C-GCAxxG-C-C family protein [Desulfobulbaceae bacterium]
MEKEQTIEAIRERAKGNFSKGYNCAECVLEAVLATVDVGLPPESLKMATGFGGGIGLFGDTCGAISGAVMAVGAIHGRTRLPQNEDRKEAMKAAGRQLYGRPGLYRLFNQIPNRIQEQYGHTLCRDLTTKWRDGQWLCRDHAINCRNIIGEAAGVAAELLCADQETAGAAPFGQNVENIRD